MLAVALGLAAAACWGVGDFMGGLASRRAVAFAVVPLVLAAGSVVLLVALAAAGFPAPTGRQLLFGGMSGLGGGLGLIAFYRAFAIGSMSLVAPISALGALVPVSVDLIGGASPAAMVLVGMAVALAGGALAAHAPGPATRRGLGLALIAALGFGLFFATIGPAADDGIVWAAMSSRMVSTPLTAVAALAIGVRLSVPGSVVPLVLAAGVLDTLANLAFAAGSNEGLTSVVAVLGSLYPVGTVLLARIVLGERMGRLQGLGAAAAVVGVALIAAG